MSTATLVQVERKPSHFGSGHDIVASRDGRLLSFATQISTGEWQIANTEEDMPHLTVPDEATATAWVTYIANLAAGVNL